MNRQRFPAVTVFALLALAALYLGAGARDGVVVAGGGQRRRGAGDHRVVSGAG